MECGANPPRVWTQPDMQPTSALAFSYQDITLFARRAGNRWLSLGAVKLNDPDLQGALSDLRGEAIADSGAGFTTLLILPHDQVLYTTATVSTEADAPTEIAEQLKGLTPYAVADLVFDWSGDGAVRQVAAVARETLHEAEGFATGHGFNPVAFSAHVPVGEFDGQPYFGTCTRADALLSGAVLTRETGPFRITKVPVPPVPKPAPAPANTATFSTQRADTGNAVVAAQPNQQAAPQVQPSKTALESGLETGLESGLGLGLPVPPARNRLGIWLTLGLLLLLLLVGAIALMNASPDNNDAALDLLPDANAPQGGDFSAVALAPQPDELAPEPEPLDTAGFEPATLPSEDDVIAEELAAEAPIPLPTPLQIVEIYAATGVWIATPDAPEPASEDVLLSLYQTNLDDPIAHADAVALPKASDQFEATLPRRYLPPPPPGSTFTLDARGLVTPTADGVVTPDGVQVIAGAPPVQVLPPQRPTSPNAAATDDAGDAPTAAAAQRALLARVRPTPRPANSADAVERSENNGLTFAELRRPEPTPRPKSLQTQAEEEARLSASVAAAAAQAAQQASLASPGAAATGTGQRPTNPGAIASLGTSAEPPLRVTPQSDSALAIARSAAPRTRPADADQRVAAIQQRAAPPATAAVAAVAPRPQAPATTRTLPTGSSVARAATQANALSLREVSLIGVFGKPSAPKALVRLRNGRTVRVGVGDRVDSGQVTSIAPGRLTYRKGSRDLVLEMPRI